jgi:pimeloyl-ACP methyl ester carboxylesterase
MAVAREETFGPVAPLFRFKTRPRRSAGERHRVRARLVFLHPRHRPRLPGREALEYGIVGVNEGLITTEVAPFGGVKESGVGREGSKYGIEDYLEAFRPGRVYNVSMWGYWDAIHCPALVLRGAWSDLLLADTAAEMAERGPRAEVVEIEGCGHAPALMDEGQIRLVTDWLARTG